ncbi:MAG: hypothetical protein JXA71_07225 [Chitinispirillaceae bacterium]|nr:hypothetical protein [Chitinispirillaceae bacterium]
MNTKPAMISRSLIILTAVTFLLAFSLPVSAGQAKRSGKQSEQSAHRGSDAERLSLPSPVVDETPINPVAKEKNSRSGDRKNQSRGADQQKKRPRR